MPKPFFTDSHNKILREIIRVNHAGEFGAQKIYQGQIKYAKTPGERKLFQHMLDQEQEHLDYFSDKIRQGQSRPTILIPIWRIGGYMLGAISAKISTRAAMLVTQTVEEVIEDHYQHQIDYLSEFDPGNSILAKIKKFKSDETEHKNIAIAAETYHNRFANFMKINIKTICKAAIFLSRKL